MTAPQIHTDVTGARPEFYRFHNGEKAPLPFAASEYDQRLTGLRRIMAETGGETRTGAESRVRNRGSARNGALLAALTPQYRRLCNLFARGRGAIARTFRGWGRCLAMNASAATAAMIRIKSS